MGVVIAVVVIVVLLGLLGVRGLSVADRPAVRAGACCSGWVGCAARGHPGST